MKAGEIFAVLDRRFPCETACEYDNPGFLIGDRETGVTGVLVTLDCTHAALDAAGKCGCNLIVSHHPVIFEPLHTVTAESVVHHAIKSGVSVISMHTNLDMGNGGVNDCLAAVIGLRNVEPYRTADGFLTRKGTVDPVLPHAFAERLKTVLGGGVKYTAPQDKPIRQVLICGGSGGEMVAELPRANCDALVTADVKHHHFVEAENRGLALFDAGHFETEDTVTEPLAAFLRENFPTLAVQTFHPRFLNYM